MNPHKSLACCAPLGLSTASNPHIRPILEATARDQKLDQVAETQSPPADIEALMNWQLPIAAILASGMSWNAHGADISPYAGQEMRAIKALSSEEISGLLEGSGLGYAKAAELNGYPGPSHVLELADELGLSDEQRTRTRSAFLEMQAEAKAWGAKLVEAERQLDEQFRDRSATEASLAEALDRIASLQARVRAAHLQAHLVQTRILRKEQVDAYIRLRGYAEGKNSGHGHHHGGR
jgi:hypothetical protein